jgi:hypothetical protein
MADDQPTEARVVACKVEHTNWPASRLHNDVSIDRITACATSRDHRCERPGVLNTCIMLDSGQGEKGAVPMKCA